MELESKEFIVTLIVCESNIKIYNRLKFLFIKCLQIYIFKMEKLMFGAFQ